MNDLEKKLGKHKLVSQILMEMNRKMPEKPVRLILGFHGVDFERDFDRKKSEMSVNNLRVLVYLVIYHSG